ESDGSLGIKGAHRLVRVQNGFNHVLHHKLQNAITADVFCGSRWERKAGPVMKRTPGRGTEAPPIAAPGAAATTNAFYVSQFTRSLRRLRY
ncbi:MAG TPA: hypothetical protein VGX70_13105, partial [Gemmataceae bacterium]|nr:hypothetical protein [Gemmataceae bacterium]